MYTRRERSMAVRLTVSVALLATTIVTFLTDHSVSGEIHDYYERCLDQSGVHYYPTGVCCRFSFSIYIYNFLSLSRLNKNAYFFKSLNELTIVVRCGKAQTTGYLKW